MTKKILIVMSADGHIEEKKRRTDAQAFIRKPIDIVSFLDAIELYCK